MRIGFLGAIGWIGVAAAGPLQWEDVSSDAKWVIHLDVEQLKQSRLGDQVEARLTADHRTAKLDAFAAIFNFDPREDLTGITLYGAEGRAERSAVVLYGAFDGKRLVTLVRANESYRTVKHGREILHSWLDEDEQTRTYGWIGDGMAVLSKGRSMIEQVVDVMIRKAPGLSRDNDLMQNLEDTAAVIVIAGVQLEELKDVDPNVAMLKKARTVQFFLREAGDEVACSLRLVADSARTAGLVERVLEGMIAFGALREGENPQLAELSESAQVRRDGSAIELDLRLSVNAVVALLQKEMDERHVAGDALGTE
jgi:hypothetical protein